MLAGVMHMLRITLLGVLLALAAFPALAAEQCPRPPGIPEPRLEFSVTQSQLVLHHDVDLLGLPRIQGHVETVPPGSALQGLTFSNDKLEIGISWRMQRFSNGNVCLWIDKVTATLGLPEQQVYVAANYPEGSCEYRAILAHENRHVAINRDTVQAHVPAIRQALLEGIRASNPLFLSTEPDKQLLARRLQSFTNMEFQVMRAELRQRNGAIDTPEAYRQQQKDSGCRNWKMK